MKHWNLYLPSGKIESFKSQTSLFQQHPSPTSAQMSQGPAFPEDTLLGMLEKHATAGRSRGDGGRGRLGLGR